MTVPPSEVERRVSLFAQALRESGLRLTHQRLEVAREIARSDMHPNVEAIYCGVRERVPTISLDTVYRTLGALERLGLINRIDVMAGPARYDAKSEHHHHFICARCGLIRDLPSASYGALEVPEAAAILGEVESISVQLRGLCRECQEQQKHHDRWEEAFDDKPWEAGGERSQLAHRRCANLKGTKGDRR